MQRFYPSAMFQSLSLAVLGALRIPPCHDEGLGFFHLGQRTFTDCRSDQKLMQTLLAGRRRRSYSARPRLRANGSHCLDSDLTL